MTKILSWNIHTNKGSVTKDLQRVITEIVNENFIDIIVLQEAFGSFINTALNAGLLQYDEILFPGNTVQKGVRIFTKQNTFHTSTFIKKGKKGNKLKFVSLKKLNGTEEFNIAGVHLHSKVGNTERQRLWKSLPIIEEIKEFEKKSLNNRTIIVGDFNHNPYEINLCDPYYLNAKDSKNLITTLTTKPISKKFGDFWYNPMWNLLGDYDYTSSKKNKERVTGTYFRYTEDETPIWNLIDGFILRPSIMDRVNYKECKIITSTKSEPSFLKPLTIAKNESLIYEYLSDHLPIKFSITIN